MNVLVIGLGSIGRRHIKVLRTLRPAADIYALRRSESRSDLDGVINIQNLNELKTAPDFTIIANPTYLHAAAIKSVLGFGTPVFIEKPVAEKLDGLDELAHIIKCRKTTTYVACNLRFLHAIGFVKDFLEKESPELFEVNVYCGSYLPGWRPGTDHRAGYSAHESLGGGVHLDLIHELDYIYWWLGKPVSATRNLRRLSGVTVDSADYANHFFIYPRTAANVVLNYFRRDAKRTCELVFGDDTWVVDLHRNEIRSALNGRIVFSSKQTIQDTYYAQMEYFLSGIKNGSAIMNPISEGLEVLKMCLGYDDVKK